MSLLDLPGRCWRRLVSGSSASGGAVPSAEWRLMQQRIGRAGTVVDLGCGNSPHGRATVAVDAFLEPVQRGLGSGPRIDAAAMRRRNVHFVRADLAELPFADKSFDIAYSHHAFEHLPDPKRACREMCRIARAGAIVAPSAFSEIAFGRPYHLWLVLARGSTLIFVRKAADEDRPFGQHPGHGRGRLRANGATNPFEILLNYGGWYNGFERLPRLARALRRLWHSHSPVAEVVFTWEHSFDAVVIHEDGRVE